MKIAVNDLIHLSEFRPTDKSALVQHLNDRAIYDRTLRIPFPYTDAAAEEWFAFDAGVTAKQGRPANWAIRTADEALIGGCGFDWASEASHRGEIGYWLAQSFRGRGIMTDVVRRLCRHLFEEFRVMKITAHVFSHNAPSARVLEKCGFQEEGFLRKHFIKDGRCIDVRLYACLNIRDQT